AVRETAGAPAQRAPRLAADLQALWPSPLYACLLRTNGGTTYSAQLQGGATPPGDDQLRSELQRWLDACPPDAPAACLDVPPGWKLPGHGVVAAPLASGGRRV